MLFSNFANALQLIASPLFFAAAAVVSVLLIVALMRLLATQRRLAHTRRLPIEAGLAEHCVEPVGKPDRKGRMPRKGLKLGAEQEPGSDKKEESAGV